MARLSILVLFATLGLVQVGNAPPEEKPATADALVEQALAAARSPSGSLDAAIGLAERALSIEPGHRQALRVLADLAQEQAVELDRPANSPYYLKSARAIRDLRDRWPALTAEERNSMATYFYNEACTFALQGEAGKALDALGDAVAAGFDAADVMAGDPELKSVRDLPGFAELAGRVEQNAQATAARHAEALEVATAPFRFGFILPDLSGKPVALDQLKGRSITIVNLWGTWCPPCRRQVSTFETLLKQHRRDGLAVIGVNYERSAPEAAPARVKAFVQAHGISYPCVIGDDSTRSQVPDFAGYPTTLFLDHEGEVRVVVVGFRPLRDLEAIVERLLDASQNDSTN